MSVIVVVVEEINAGDGKRTNAFVISKGKGGAKQANASMAKRRDAARTRRPAVLEHPDGMYFRRWCRL